MSAPDLAALEQLTEDEIQAKLAGTATAGPKKFRGRELANYSSGLRDLVLKIVRYDDTAAFHDMAVIYVLGEAFAVKQEQALARRRALLEAADDVAGFRARISLEWVDTLTDEEMKEARRLVTAILAPVELAQTAIVTAAGAKKGAPPRLNRTAKSS